MTTNANVIVTAAGSIVGQGIIKALKMNNKDIEKKVDYKIIALDMNIQANSLYRSDLGLVVPPASSTDYIDSIIEICRNQKIDSVFAGSDQELLPLAQSTQQIENESGAKVLTNSPDVISICSDKWKTFEFLKKNNLACAESCLPENKSNLISEFGFPLVVKPREGYGSLHFYVVKNEKELEYAISKIQDVGWNALLQEYLEGEDAEFTSGVTVDRSGQKIMSSISMRRILKNGQTNKAIIDENDLITESANDAALKLGGRGAINVQAKLVNNHVKIFEINPRFSASTPIRAVAGVNEPDIVFRNKVLGEEIKIENHRKLVCMRYLDEIYIPFSSYQEAIEHNRVENTNSFKGNYF